MGYLQNNSPFISPKTFKATARKQEPCIMNYHVNMQKSIYSNTF